MPKYMKRSNIVSKYLGREVGNAMESASYIAGGLGAAVIASQLVNRYTDNQDVSKLTGLGVAATFGFTPAIAYLLAFAPSLTARIRGRF
jgi:hypothetical protein